MLLVINSFILRGDLSVNKDRCIFKVTYCRLTLSLLQWIMGLPFSPQRIHAMLLGEIWWKPKKIFWNNKATYNTLHTEGHVYDAQKYCLHRKLTIGFRRTRWKQRFMTVRQWSLLILIPILLSENILMKIRTKHQLVPVGWVISKTDRSKQKEKEGRNLLILKRSLKSSNRYIDPVINKWCGTPLYGSEPLVVVISREW